MSIGSGSKLFDQEDSKIQSSPARARSCSSGGGNDSELSVTIETSEEEEIEHLFKSFDDRDAVFKALRDLQTRVHIPRNKKIFRTSVSSDNFELTAGDETQSPKPNRRRYFTTPDWMHENSFSENQITKQRSFSEEVFEPILPKSSETLEDFDDQPLRKQVSSRTIDTEEVVSHVPLMTGGGEKTANSNDWHKAKKDLKEYPFVAVDSQVVIGTSLDSFCASFIENNAPHSIPSFQKAIGDSNIEVTSWQAVDGKSQKTRNQMERMISFLHPRNSKLGPSKVKTSKKQTCERFDPFGIVMLSQTTVEGVPYSDCFVMEDIWIIQPSSNETGQSLDEQGNDNDTYVSLSVNFRIRFLKNTMFKKMIENQTKKEVLDWYEMYMKMVLSSLVPNHEMPSVCSNENFQSLSHSTSDTKAETANLQKDDETSLMDLIVSELQKTLSPILCLIVMLLWMFYHVMVLMNRLDILEKEMIALKHENGVLIRLFEGIMKK